MFMRDFWCSSFNALCWIVAVNALLINDRCDEFIPDVCKVPHAYCQPINTHYGLCTCDKGYVASRYETTCLPVLGLISCRQTSECEISNTVCSSSGRCVCNPQYVASRDRTSCLPPLGRSCLVSKDCAVANSQCGDGVCSCQDQYLASREKTVCLPVLGKRCSNDNSCVVDNSYCDNGLCGCFRDTFVPSYNKTICLPVVNTILAPCYEDLQCMNNELGHDTRCLNNQCVCRYGNTVTDTKCDKRKVLDDWCNHTQQCQMISHASCVQAKCSCDPYYVPRANDRTACVPIAIVYGSSCDDDIQCTVGFGEGGKCINGTCQCISGHHFIINQTGRCIPNKGLGNSCTANECYLPLDADHQNVECVDNECRCKAGVKPGLDNNSCSGTSSSLHLKTINPVSIMLLLSFLAIRSET